LKPLLQRPYPFPDESLKGYIARLAVLNMVPIIELYREVQLTSGKHPANLFMTYEKLPSLELLSTKVVDLPIIKTEKEDKIAKQVIQLLRNPSVDLLVDL
jgi:hypothetical protein